MSDLDMRARETWWSLCQMSYTGDRPDLRKQDVEEIASLIRDLASDARQLAETREALSAIVGYRECQRFDMIPCRERAEIDPENYCPLCAYLYSHAAVSPADTTEAG